MVLVLSDLPKVDSVARISVYVLFVFFCFFLILCVFVQVSVVVGWGECVCVSGGKGGGRCWSVAGYINWNFLHFWPHMLAKPRSVITL